MATTLGKRKRAVNDERPAKCEARKQERENSESPQLDAQEIFRRHFEAQFKPLPGIRKATEQVEEISDAESDGESEWEGMSEPADHLVEVIEHSESLSKTASMSKEELKAFMGSKPPKNTPSASRLRERSISANDDDASESANLKNDLALQRLLSESHLLDSSKSPTLSGNNRHKATDLRLQALGSKASIFKQEKMPLSHRKGITAKRVEKEQKRRREARENGVILEKAKIKSKISSSHKRDRGVGGPAVGKFSGGTLKLSKKDIGDIEGPRRSLSGKGTKGRRK